MKPCTCGRTPVMIMTIRARVRAVRVECPCGRQTGTLAWVKPKDTLEMKEAAAVVWDTLADESQLICQGTNHENCVIQQILIE